MNIQSENIPLQPPIQSNVIHTIMTRDRRSTWNQNKRDLIRLINMLAYKKQLPGIFDQYFRYASEIHTYTIQDIRPKAISTRRASYRTNVGKQTTKAMVVDVWQDQMS